jgi:hypothetical protein
MAKWQNDAMLDAGLAYISGNTTQIVVCSQQPATYAEATSTYKLASKTGLSGSSFTGPANGDVSGRKITVNAQTTDNATGTGTGNHVALCSGSVLLYVTTFTGQVITTGNPVNIAAWDIELLDVTP